VKTHLRRCDSCSVYTLKEACPKCQGATSMPIPAKYSPEDRYGKYRRQLKDEIREGA
jgi:H/ACA ribonucleoprotein complex subunit 3